jgi:predicted O-methyltransferase YrrM
MNSELSGFLAELHRSGVERDAAEPDRRNRLRNMDPAAVALVTQLVRSLRPASVLEIGTSNAYSTIWLGDAAADHGGRVVSVEADPTRFAEAGANLALAETLRPGLLDAVTLVLGDAAAQVRRSTGADLILLDAERTEYPRYWADVRRVLAASRGTLVIDNAVSHADELTPLVGLIRDDAELDTAVVPVGAGLRLVTWRSA